jgi:prepilin-type N-terminal cleavage/methylation domain-containing protein
MQRKQTEFNLVDNHKGFTLIECLIAMAIFGIGILAISQLQWWNTQNNTTGNITTMAAMLARQQIETFKNTSDVTTLTSGTDPNNPVTGSGGPGGIFTRTWTVSDPLGSSTSRLVTVRVSWDRVGQNRSVVLSSLTRGNGT